MAEKLVTVFGGSGFLGRYVVQKLAHEGYRVRVAVRYPNRALFLKPLGSLGQVQIVQANVRNADSVKRAVKGADAVINLVGILMQNGAQIFSAIQEEGAIAIAKAAKKAKVQNLVHISAIGADEHSPSKYARTKARGEAGVKKAFKNATILRPSIMIGPEDDFANRFAGMAKISPVLPIVGAGTKFQPVYVGDVANAILKAVQGGSTVEGKTFELGGPTTYTFRDLIKKVLVAARLKRPVVNLPNPLAKMMAIATAILPKPPITLDQIKQLQIDNVVAPKAKGFRELGISPTSIEVIMPKYLMKFWPKGQFTESEKANLL